MLRDGLQRAAVPQENPASAAFDRTTRERGAAEKAVRTAGNLLRIPPGAVSASGLLPEAHAPARQRDEDLSNLKIQFLATLNHEIRTPLSGIMGMMDLLLETRLDEEQREYVEATRACAETLFSVLNATLDYSALAAGRVILQEAEFHLSDAVRHCLADFEATARGKGIQLRCTFDDELPETVIGDELRLRQVLAQLISNGVKFTLEGEVEVHVLLEEQSGGRATIVFKVRDTGIGIPKEQLDAIFDSFHQLDSGLSRSYSGLGLGLALSEKLISLMDGQIWAESKMGVGSAFYVRLSFPLPEESPAGGSSEHSGQGTGKLLVVEDDEVARRVVSHVLGRTNYQVTLVAGGAEAIEAAAREQFDLILMDLQMPGTNGLEATEQIRAFPGYEDVPVIALTANSAEAHQEVCRRAGMKVFLTKPVQADDLLSAIARQLSQ